MKDAADESHHEHDKREERENGVGGNRKGECVNVGLGQILDGCDQQTEGAARRTPGWPYGGGLDSRYRGNGWVDHSEGKSYQRMKLRSSNLGNGSSGGGLPAYFFILVKVIKDGRKVTQGHITNSF